MRVLDLDLGLLPHFDPADELGGALHRNDAARASIENPQPQGRLPRRFPGAVKPVVLLVVFALEVGASLAQDSAKSRVGARARHPKLQLAFDASIPRTM